MNKETTGHVASVARQWWFKVNTKALRLGPLDGAVFPHIIKVIYVVEGKEFSKRKWIPAGKYVPQKGSKVRVEYDPDKPSRAKIHIERAEFIGNII